jgi:glycosyltransferase involved in cell wall biosynthesis
MLSDTHDAYDDRIYWKESISLSLAGYKLIHICVGDTSDSHLSAEGVNIIQLKRYPYFVNRFIRKLSNFLPFLNLHHRIYLAARKQKADIYHLHDLRLLNIIKKLKRLPWKPKVFHCIRESYGDSIRDYASSNVFVMSFKKFYARYIEHWEIRKIRPADRIITIDNATYAKFSKIYGDKVSIVYNFSSLFPDENHQEPKLFDLIYTGGMNAYRGILKIIESVAIAKINIPSIKLLLLGKFHDPNFKKLLLEQIHELGVEQHVDIIDSVPHPEVKKYLAQSKIGLVALQPIPKFFKNIPIKQFEYMAFGLPVIGSNLPPIEDFIKRINAGIIIDPTKPEMIAGAIVELLTNKELYMQLSDNAFNAARDIYNWKSEAEKLTDIYDSELHNPI